MDGIQSVINAALAEAMPVLTLIGKITAVGAATIVLAWFSVEHLFSLIPRLRTASPDVKRALAIVVGQAAVFTLHTAGAVNFGDGPQGWYMAGLSGLFGGGFAPWLHDKLKARFPDAVNSGPPAAPAAPGGGQ